MNTNFWSQKRKVGLTALGLALVMIAVALAVILTMGRTATVAFNVTGLLAEEPDRTAEDFDITMEQDQPVVRETGRKLDGSTLKVSYASGRPGKTFVSLDIGPGIMEGHTLMVFRSGIITQDSLFGRCRGDRIIPVLLALYLSFVLFLFLRSYRSGMKECLYQYKNIAFLGVSIYLFFLVLHQLSQIPHYGGPGSTITNFISGFKTFAVVTFPIALVVAVLVTISNLVLVKNEGRSLRNLLGVFLGLLVIAGVLLPELLSYKLQTTSSFINVHNMNGPWLYLETFVETLISQLVVYGECLLAATIIIALKAARRIPAFDKDYIAILGCKFRDDGTLTPLLRSRVDCAIEFARMQKEATGKELLFVPSGGQGPDEVCPEAEAMKRYMVQQGIPEDQIILEDQSRNTYENVQFTRRLMEDKIPGGKMAFSTTNYHVLRSGAYAWKQGIPSEGIGAPTKAYYWINAFIREFIASTEAAKKQHLFVFALITLASVLSIVFFYFNNNL